MAIAFEQLFLLLSSVGNADATKFSTQHSFFYCILLRLLFAEVDPVENRSCFNNMVLLSSSSILPETLANLFSVEPFLTMLDLLLSNCLDLLYTDRSICSKQEFNPAANSLRAIGQFPLQVSSGAKNCSMCVNILFRYQRLTINQLLTFGI